MAEGLPEPSRPVTERESLLLLWARVDSLQAQMARVNQLERIATMQLQLASLQASLKYLTATLIFVTAPLYGAVAWYTIEHFVR